MQYMFKSQPTQNIVRIFYLFSSSIVILLSLFVLFGQHAVYRYPRLALDPVPRPIELENNFGIKITAEGAYFKQSEQFHLRAFRPEVKLHIHLTGKNQPITIKIENIHPDSTLRTGGKAKQLSEKKSGLLREIIIEDSRKGDVLNLTWVFPEKDSYRFAAIGDTGGDKALTWSLIRAKEVGADFLLHLGDVYYNFAEVGRSVARMNAAEIPVYTAVGNHDYRGHWGNTIDTFIENIGPVNARFELLGHCFINLDTGNFMYPPHKGERAGLLTAELVNHKRKSSNCTDYIIYTHKPIISDFKNSLFPSAKHTLYGYDALWLLNQLQQLENVTIITGHIHDNFEFKQDELRTFVSGNGLAGVTLDKEKSLVRILVGTIRKETRLITDWETY